MAITITPAKKGDVTRIICPDCGEKLRSVGLLKDSHIDGLTFTCKRCRALWHVSSSRSFSDKNSRFNDHRLPK